MDRDAEVSKRSGYLQTPSGRSTPFSSIFRCRSRRTSVRLIDLLPKQRDHWNLAYCRVPLALQRLLELWLLVNPVPVPDLNLFLEDSPMSSKRNLLPDNWSKPE